MIIVKPRPKEVASEEQILNSILNHGPEVDIDPDNGVNRIQLLLNHTGICLCTFLIGRMSRSSWKRTRWNHPIVLLKAGVQPHRNGDSSHHVSTSLYK